MRHSDASGVGDLGVVEQNGIDLEQTQLLGAAVDDVVDPPLDPVEPGLIAMSEVLRVQPAVGVDGCRGALGIFEVARGDNVAANADLTFDVSSCNLLPGEGIDQSHLAEILRGSTGRAHRNASLLAVEERRRHDLDRHSFCQAVEVGNAHTLVSEGLLDVRWNRFAGDMDANTAQVELRPGRVLHQVADHRRHDEIDPARSKIANHRRHSIRLPAPAPDYGGAGDHPLGGVGDAARVEHADQGQIAVATGDAAQHHGAHRRGAERPVREHDALRDSGGAGREVDRGEVAMCTWRDAQGAGRRLGQLRQVAIIDHVRDGADVPEPQGDPHLVRSRDQDPGATLP